MAIDAYTLLYMAIYGHICDYISLYGHIRPKMYILGVWTVFSPPPPKPCASVSQLPAALRPPQKKLAPGSLEHVSCGCCNC